MDLAEAIAAAVGPQPVPQVPAAKPSTVPALGQQQQGQELSKAQPCHPPQHQPWPEGVQASPAAPSCPVDVLTPVRRPTAAEARAASPPAQCPTQQELQQEGSRAAAAAASYDNMDSLITEQQQPGAAVVVASLGAGAAHPAHDLAAHAQQLSQQQQQQLLSQLWSELQAPQQQIPAAAAAADARCCTSPGLHSPATAGSSLQPSSSFCSSEQAGLAAAALAAAAAATAAPVAPDSPCSSVPSRALSSCSTSSSKKRVSWGDAVVYQLPPEEPTPLLAAAWRRVRTWFAEDAAACYEVLEDGSRAVWPAAAATTALVSVAAAAAVAALIAHRVHSS